MASAYNLEPQTNAKVILKTTYGDLDIELWAVQTPLTSRNFLQLCLDGYYNGTIFHRLVPNFILQGGDPTGTGHGGEAIYDGGLFADEFHTRLRFNRRGLVGMANSGRKDDNGSQFFLTLGDTKELTGRNTMFGKIVGDTLYNLVRMGESECEEGTERPVYPVKILGAEVVINPFEDMKPREAVKKTETLEDAARARKAAAAKKKKGGKALLSFGGDEGDEPAAPVSKKPKFNTRLVVAAPLSDEKPVEQKEKTLSAPSTTGSRNAITTTETITPPAAAAAKDSLAEPTPEPPKPTPTRSSRSPSSSPEPSSKPSSALSQTNAQIAALKASLRRRSSPPPAATTTKKRSLLSLQKAMLPPTSIQGRKRKRGKAAATDDSALAALARFQSKLSSATSIPTPSSTTTNSTPAGAPDAAKDILDDDPEGTLCDLHFIPACASCGLYERERADRSQSPETEGLWGHTLSFEKDRLGKDLNWKKRNEELSVVDPREKEKEILGAGRKGGRKEEDERRRMRGGGRGAGDWRGEASGSGSGSGGRGQRVDIPGRGDRGGPSGRGGRR